MNKWKLGALIGAIWGFVSARAFLNFIIITLISDLIFGLHKVTFTLLGKVICFPTWMVVKFYFHDTINLRFYTMSPSIYQNFIGSIIIGALIGGMLGLLIPLGIKIIKRVKITE